MQDMTHGGPEIVLVAAVGRNGVIGKQGGLVWKLPGDLPRFKQLTTGHPVVMGRATWDSLPVKPLPGRRNYVMTRQPDWHADGATAVRSLDEVLAAESWVGTVMVVGGAAIYELALPFANRLELTEVQAEAEGDAYFPAFDRGRWAEAERISHEGDPAFDWVTYVRKA